MMLWCLLAAWILEKYLSDRLLLFVCVSDGDGNPYLRMDTSSSYVNMVWRLHRRGFGATSALDGSFIFDLFISFLEKLLLALLRISTRTDGLRRRNTRSRQLCLDLDWSTLIAIVLFPTSTKADQKFCWIHFT